MRSALLDFATRIHVLANLQALSATRRPWALAISLVFSSNLEGAQKIVRIHGKKGKKPRYIPYLSYRILAAPAIHFTTPSRSSLHLLACKTSSCSFLSLLDFIANCRQEIMARRSACLCQHHIAILSFSFLSALVFRASIQTSKAELVRRNRLEK